MHFTFFIIMMLAAVIPAALCQPTEPILSNSLTTRDGGNGVVKARSIDRDVSGHLEERNYDGMYVD
jgi:hypothetical protein